jgi:hypothetical protein
VKKFILFITSTVLIMGLIGCFNENSQSSKNQVNVAITKQQNNKVVENRDVREVVWKQLSQEKKDWIKGTWKDGKVSKITLNNNMMSKIDDKSYKGKEVYLIDFPTKNKFSVPNNMGVYADVITYDYIGNGLVD